MGSFPCKHAKSSVAPGSIDPIHNGGPAIKDGVLCPDTTSPEQRVPNSPEPTPEPTPEPNREPTPEPWTLDPRLPPTAPPAGTFESEFVD